eukprot:5452891-Amphidinium_carterae.1
MTRVHLHTLPCTAKVPAARSPVMDVRPLRRLARQLVSRVLDLPLVHPKHIVSQLASKQMLLYQLTQVLVLSKARKRRLQSAQPAIESPENFTCVGALYRMQPFGRQQC